jgi:hypothetical protein
MTGKCIRFEATATPLNVDIPTRICTENSQRTSTYQTARSGGRQAMTRFCCNPYVKIALGILLITVTVIRNIQSQVPHGTMYEETPAGVIDGVNTVFTIAHQPLPWASIKVYRNGLRMKRNLDYTLDTSNWNATKIVFIQAQTPQPGTNGEPEDVLLVDYTY